MYFSVFQKVVYLYQEQRSINNISPILFDNLLQYFKELYNSPFKKGPVFLDEKLNKVLIYSLI